MFWAFTGVTLHTGGIYRGDFACFGHFQGGCYILWAFSGLMLYILWAFTDVTLHTLDIYRGDFACLGHLEG